MRDESVPTETDGHSADPKKKKDELAVAAVVSLRRDFDRDLVSVLLL